jgi:hypothetical protein
LVCGIETCAHAEKDYRYVQVEDGSDQLYEEQYCKVCGEAVSEPRKAFFILSAGSYKINGTAVQTNISANSDIKEVTLPEDDVEVTAFGGGDWVGAKATITSFQYRVLDSNGDVIKNWTTGGSTRTGNDNSGIVNGVNSNAVNKGYASGICDARRVDGLPADLSDINEDDCILEYKFIVDAADLPEGVTDCAFYFWRITNVDCATVTAAAE